MTDTQKSLLDAISAMLPAVDESHANVVLGATLRQLSAGIDYQSLIVDVAEPDAPQVDRFAGMDFD